MLVSELYNHTIWGDEWYVGRYSISESRQWRTADCGKQGL